MPFPLGRGVRATTEYEVLGSKMRAARPEIVSEGTPGSVTPRVSGVYGQARVPPHGCGSHVTRLHEYLGRMAATL